MALSFPHFLLKMAHLQWCNPNEPKKHKKNAIHVMWKARIWGMVKFSSVMRVALFWISISFPQDSRSALFSTAKKQDACHTAAGATYFMRGNKYR